MLTFVTHVSAVAVACSRTVLNLASRLILTVFRKAKVELTKIAYKTVLAGTRTIVRFAMASIRTFIRAAEVDLVTSFTPVAAGAGTLCIRSYDVANSVVLTVFLEADVDLTKLTCETCCAGT